MDAAINLKGAAEISPGAKAIVLRGEPGDVNSIESPKKVAPQTEELTNVAGGFHRTFAPYSLTLLRVKAKAG